MKRKRRIPWKGLGIAVAIVAVIVAARVLPLRIWLGDFQTWLAGRGMVGMALFAAVYIAVALLFGPTWLLTIGAGLTYGLWRGVALVSVASTAGAALAFLIARHLARDRVERLAKSNEKFAAIDRAIGKKGWKIVALLRLSPLIPYTISNYFYGVTAVRFVPYVLASWIAMLPITVLYVSLGAAGREAVQAQRERSPWEWAALGLGLLSTIAVTVWITRLARREIKRDFRPQAFASRTAAERVQKPEPGLPEAR